MIAPLSGPPPSGLPPAEAQRIWRSAKAFEGMALGALLQPMFRTVHGAHDMFGGGNAEKIWQPMLVAEIGKQLAAAGGLGLAVPVFRAMLNAEAAKR